MPKKFSPLIEQKAFTLWQSGLSPKEILQELFEEAERGFASGEEVEIPTDRTIQNWVKQWKARAAQFEDSVWDFRKCADLEEIQIVFRHLQQEYQDRARFRNRRIPLVTTSVAKLLVKIYKAAPDIPPSIATALAYLAYLDPDDWFVESVLIATPWRSREALLLFKQVLKRYNVEVKDAKAAVFITCVLAAYSNDPPQET